MPLAGRKWVAPASNVERQAWISPAWDTSDRPRPDQGNVRDGSGGSGDQTVVPDIPSTVSAKDGLCVEQKKRRFDKMESIRIQLGFQNMLVVDSQGHKGGLALLWADNAEIEVTIYSNNHIDATVVLDIGSPEWRFTGFYGFQERGRRRDSWNFLRTLAGLSTLPWVVTGDCNDLLHQYEKRGRVPHPEWLLKGF
nr:uncharacterized protein LOC109157277 [Ipomoea batatas]